MERSYRSLWKNSTLTAISLLKSNKASFIYWMVAAIALVSLVYSYAIAAQRIENRTLETYRVLDEASRECFYGAQFNEKQDTICLQKLDRVTDLIEKYKLQNTDLGFKRKVLLEQKNFVGVSRFLAKEEKLAVLAKSKKELYTFFPSPELANIELTEYSDYQKIYFIRYSRDKSKPKSDQPVINSAVAVTSK